MSITHSGVQVRTLDIVQDGDTYYKTTQDEKTGAARAYTGFDANSTIITSILPGTDPSVQSGLNLTQTYLGYYNGAEWMSYMSIDGHFYLGGVDGSLQWNGSSLLIGGDSQLIFGTRIIPGTNILSPDVRLWEETTVPSGIGYWTEGSNPYGFDPYGSGEENNSIISTLNPFGYQDLVWECNVVSGGEEAGGWAYNTYDIDKTLRYRHTIWAKFIGGIGRNMFFGCGNTGDTSDLTLDDSDSVNNNPYFASGLELPNAIHYYDNPVANPSMELNANWNAYGNPISSQRSATRNYDGTYSWYVDLFAADVGSGARSDEFTLEGYQTYRFSIWLYGADLTTKWHIYIDDGEQRYWIKEFGYENSYVSYDTWVNHVINFQTGERSTTNRIYVVAAEMSDTAGAIYFDAVEISTQLAVFGDFETEASYGRFFTGWTHVGTPTYCERGEIGIAHSGTYSRKTTVDGIGEGVKTSKYQVAIGSSTTTSGGEIIDSTATFETANVAVDDLVYKLGGGCTYVTDVVSETQLSVNDDLFVEFDSYTINSQNSYIKFMGGHQYRASIWLLGDGITEWNAKVSDGIADYDFLETDNTPSLVPSGIWIQYMMDFEVKNNTEEGYLSLTSASAISGSATVYIDDVEIQETPWYLLTGFVHPDNYVGTDSSGGLYHYKTGYSPPTYSGIDFKSLDATAVQGFRCFQKNSDDNEENKLLLYSPAVHVVDGSEPSLSAVLGNSLNMAWNVEHTTSMSRYLLSSPTIRGGNYAGGNYIQLDAYGLRAFGAGVQTVLIDSIDGSGYLAGGDFSWDASGAATFAGGITSTATITGGVFQTASSSTRVVIDGSVNELIFYDTDDNETITIKENAAFGLSGILMVDGIFYMTDTYAEASSVAMFAGGIGVVNYYWAQIALQGINEWDGVGDNATTYTAMEAEFNEITEVDYTGERIAIRGLASVSYSGQSLNSTGLYGYADNAGSGWAVGGKFRSIDTAIKLEYNASNYVNFDVSSTSALTISPYHTDGGVISMRGAIGSSMLLVSGTDDTVHAATYEDQIMGMRIYNSSQDTGTQCGIHFGTYSAIAGIFGVRAASDNQQGLAFYTENVTRGVRMELTYDGNLIHKDILYPEIVTGGDSETRTWTIDVCDMSGTATTRIGDTAGIGSESTRGVVEWWVSWDEFGAPESITGSNPITFAVTTGTAHGAVDETTRNVATTNSSGRVVITATTTNDTGGTNVWLHVRIGAGIVYSEEAFVNTTEA